MQIKITMRYHLVSIRTATVKKKKEWKLKLLVRMLLVSCSVMSDSCMYSCSMPGFPFLHHLPELAQTRVHRVVSSVIPFSSWLQSFPESGSFPISQFFPSGGQSIGASAPASVLLMNIQSWFSLGLTGLILQSKGLSKVFSNSTVQKHQFYGT